MTDIEKKCRTCQYWNMHSIDMLKGDCMAPDDHRYWHIPITSQKTGRVSVAMMDSFGREETKPNFVCAAWRLDNPADLAGDGETPKLGSGRNLADSADAYNAPSKLNYPDPPKPARQEALDV